MRKSELTLDVVKQSPKVTEKSFQISDFLSSDEQDALHEAVYRGKQNRRLFDEVDALTAEITARFGYEVYMRWNAGEFDDDKMARWLAAERAREYTHLSELSGIIYAMVSACVRVEKGRPRPRGPKAARNLLTKMNSKAQGVA